MRFLINYLKSEEIIKDMINNQKKYKNQPCLEIEFKVSKTYMKYCFDESHKNHSAIANGGFREIIL